MVLFVFCRLGNRMEKGENACHQHFLLFPQYFKKLSSSGLLTLGIVLKRVKISIYEKRVNSFRLDKIMRQQNYETTR